MIRTTCPKCGREDAVADYLATLPILCNGCGTRVTIGEPLDSRPAFPPPQVEAPPPPPKFPPLPPPPPQAVAPPPPPKPTPLPPPAVVVPPPVPVEVPEELVQALQVAPAPVPLVPAPAVQPAAAAEPPFPLPLAGVGRRLLARFLFLLGLALMAGLGFGVLILVPKSVTRDPSILYAIVAAFPVIYLLINAAMLARTGQDVGKRYAGIRIVNADGSKATEKTALLKRDALTFVIGLTGIGLLYWLLDFVTLFGKGGRTLHDRIAGTRVVRA